MFIKRSLVQILLAAVLAFAGLLADHGFAELPGLGLLDLSATTSFVSGLAFGWAGLAGSALGWLLHCSLSFPSSCTVEYLLVSLLLAGGGAVILVLPRRFGWPLVSFQTYAAGVAIGVIGASVSAWPLAYAHDGVVTPTAFWTWWGHLTASLILVAPLLLHLVTRTVSPWVRRIWVPELPPLRPERASPARWALTLGLTVLITLAVRQSMQQPPILHEWVRLMFVVPVVLLGRYGLREGVLAGCLAGVAALLAEPPWLLHGNVDGSVGLPHQAAAIVFPLLGAVLGWAFEREWVARTELQSALANTVQALRGSLAVRHSRTEDHTVRVARYAVETGRHLELADAELEALQTAGLLHDIGKIGVPDAVLRKPGPLRFHEAELMRKHPEIGARLLQQLTGLDAAVPLVLHHQERYDGRTTGRHPGYPDGLAGDAIPLGARIIAVVDAFDAMTSDREYRRAIPVDEAITELQAERGKQFDPRVVDAFLEVLAARPWQLEGPVDPADEPAVLESAAADRSAPSPSSSQV